VILVASCAVIVTVSSLIVRYDERRLQRAADNGDARAEQRLERSWSPPSRDNALIGLALLAAPLLGLFAVWFHFFRTRSGSPWLPWRWSLTGFLLGIAAVILTMIANATVVITLAYALGLPLED
jgi:hypothetical protein